MFDLVQGMGQKITQINVKLYDSAQNRKNMTESLLSLTNKVVGINNNIEGEKRTLDRNREERKTFALLQMTKFNSTENKLLNLNDRLSNSVILHQDLKLKMLQQLNDMSRLETHLISGFNNNSLEQNKLVRKMHENELQQQMQLEGLNISIFATAYTLLKSQITNMVSLKGILNKTDQNKESLNGTIIELYKTINHLKNKHNEFINKYNDSILEVFREIEDRKRNNTDIKNYMNERIKIIYEELGKLDQSNNSSKEIPFTTNVTVLHKELEELKEGTILSFISWCFQ